MNDNVFVEGKMLFFVYVDCSLRCKIWKGLDFFKFLVIWVLVFDCIIDGDVIFIFL